jgi:hypothetical protein
MFFDQYKDKHYPMKYISQITSPDLLDLEYIDPEDINSEEKNILSAPQIAHFVRCIPFRTSEDSFDTWSSPDFLLSLKKGSIVDHALLMASLF